MFVPMRGVTQGLVCVGMAFQMSAVVSTWSAYAGERIYDRERAALRSLNETMICLTGSLSEIEDLSRSIRSRESGDRAVAGFRARMVAEIEMARKCWLELNSLEEQANEENLILKRQIHLPFLRAFPELSEYLSIRREGRRHIGFDLSFLVRSWIGLRVGEKRRDPPAELGRFALHAIDETGAMRRVVFDETGFLVIVTTNGGLIRGQPAGRAPNRQLVLREVLPVSLIHNQKDGGHYRLVDLTSVARMDLVHHDPQLTFPSAPPSVISTSGAYSRAFVRTHLVQRIVIQPTDEELMSQRRIRTRSAGRDVRPRLVPKTEVLKSALSGEFEPPYGRPVFMRCADRLRLL